ncbi:transposase [Vibrio rotiferianus]|nr:transposase [Vibrio rotiferianus]CAH1559427.1 transposase [Vibrio rotiferianus]
MSKPRYKTTNWKQYNQALINRGSLTFWIDAEAIAKWKQGKRGRPRRFSDISITTALMVKRVFSMQLMPRVSRFIAKVNGSSRIMVLTGSV